MHKSVLWAALMGLGVLVFVGRPPSRATISAQDKAAVLFDDFTYTTQDEFNENGWIVRTAPGWPGIPDAAWWADGVTFVDEAANDGNRLVQLISRTDGTTTNQAQICQQRKFLEGTYASRVRFSDAPRSGPDGDHIVQTFYLISPLEYEMDPNYSEVDYEYLPNGGWGIEPHVLFATTWETFRPEPDWYADNKSDYVTESFDGWHTLLIQLADQEVSYYVDGELLASHRDRYFPEVPMSINYNLWFIRDGLMNDRASREYVEQIDWVYFEANTVLDQDEVEARIAELRDAGVSFIDTVPAWEPFLESPCNF